MKYLFIFLISFSFASPALAARQVKGAVPDLPPLQAAPAGIAPNFGKNIQYSDPAHPAQAAVPTDSRLLNSNTPGNEAVVVSPGVPYQKTGSWLWWVFGILILGGGGAWIIRKFKNS